MVVSRTGGAPGLIATPSGYQFARTVAEWLKGKYARDRGTAGTENGLFIPVTYARFGNSDGKVTIRDHIRGRDVFIIADVESHAAPVAADRPFRYETHIDNDGLRITHGNEPLEIAHEKLWQDVHFMDVCRTAEAAKNALKKSGIVTLVMPCMASGRQDRRTGRESLDLKLRLGFLREAGVDHIITLDPHTYAVDLAVSRDMTMDMLRSTDTFLRYLRTREDITTQVHFTSPDTGKQAVDAIKYYANRFHTEFGAVYKQRDLTRINTLGARLGYLGDTQHIQGKNIILADDMIDTAGTMLEAATFLKDHGAQSIRLMATHPVLSLPAEERITTAYEQGTIEEVIVTNSITLSETLQNTPWMTVVDVAQYHAKVIDRLHYNESISELLN